MPCRIGEDAGCPVLTALWIGLVGTTSARLLGGADLPGGVFIDQDDHVRRPVNSCRTDTVEEGLDPVVRRSIHYGCDVPPHVESQHVPPLVIAKKTQRLG